MVKHKCKRRKVFRYKLKKVSITVSVCFFLCILGVWRITSHLQYDKQVAFANEEIFSALGSRNCVELVRPDEDTTLIKGAINTQVSLDTPYLIVMVSSLPSNELRRNVIRNTWAKKDHTKNAIVRFFLGKPKTEEEMKNLELESKFHGDVIVDDFEEHYYKLSLKSLRLLKWFLQNKKSDTQFVAKTDDDVYVNITNVISYLKQDESVNLNYSSFIGGQLYKNTYVDTDPYSKWYVPPQLWDPEIVLPPFVGGPFYVMSTEVARKIIEKSQTVPAFHLEDVFISGILGSYHLKIIPVNIPNVFSTIPKSYWPRIHFYYVKYLFDSRSVLAYHTYSVIDLIEIIYDSSVS